MVLVYGMADSRLYNKQNNTWTISPRDHVLFSINAWEGRKFFFDRRLLSDSGVRDFVHSRPQSPSFLGHVVGIQIRPSGSGDENGLRGVIESTGSKLGAILHTLRCRTLYVIRCPPQVKVFVK